MRLYDASNTIMENALDKLFWDKVDKAGDDDCWLWKASTAGKGYGQIKLPGQRKQEYAHRRSYKIHYGEIPKGIKVLHECDTPRCVNPKHLFLGTSGDNAQDMKEKGRHLYGEKNTETKLTEADVVRIHELAESGMSHPRIAKQYPVGRQTVDRIARGERWHHIWLKRQSS